MYHIEYEQHLCAGFVIVSCHQWANLATLACLAWALVLFCKHHTQHSRPPTVSAGHGLNMKGGSTATLHGYGLYACPLGHRCGQLRLLTQ